MILAACIALGLLLRFGARGTIRDLGSVHLRGEMALVGFLLVQAILPALPLFGAVAHFAFYIWLATFPFLVLIAWWNRSQPGMLVVATGLLLNMLVIIPNAGMPVSPAAFAVAGASGALEIPARDFIHVMGSAASSMPWLADIIPLPGPSWLRAIPSPGDCLLYAGVVAFLGTASGANGYGQIRIR